MITIMLLRRARFLKGHQSLIHRDFLNAILRISAESSKLDTITFDLRGLSLNPGDMTLPL